MFHLPATVPSITGPQGITGANPGRPAPNTSVYLLSPTPAVIVLSTCLYCAREGCPGGERGEGGEACEGGELKELVKAKGGFDELYARDIIR